MRPDYCPVGGEPCQSLCETPCSNTRKRLTKKQRATLIEAADHLSGDGHFMDASDADWAAEWLRKTVKDHP